VPDEAGKLTVEEKTRAAEWINQHWHGTKQCPICHQTVWNIADHVVQPITVGQGGGLMLGGIGYPQIQVVSVCGYTMYFNAVMMGLFPPNPSSQTEQK